MDVVLTGHVHVPFAIERQPNETEVISIGAGTLSTRRRDKPASFNHISVDQKMIKVSAIDFTDGKFLTTETFSKRVDALNSRRPLKPSNERDVGYDKLS